MNDWYVGWAGSVLPLALHWGHMAQVYINFDRAMLNMKRIIAEPNYEVEGGCIVVGCAVYAHLVWSCRMGAEQRSAVAAMMESAELTWSTADATVDLNEPRLNWMRPRGSKSAGEEFSGVLVPLLMNSKGALTPSRSAQHSRQRS